MTVELHILFRTMELEIRTLQQEIVDRDRLILELRQEISRLTALLDKKQLRR